MDPADRAYYESEIRPLIKVSPWVEFIGEIGDAQKSEFLSSAHVLLFPINWPEPFGLAMIESMACGTPVIGFDRGSVPEVVEDGLSGFVVGNEAAAIRAVSRLGELDRRLDVGSSIGASPHDGWRPTMRRCINACATTRA